jgi:hypothetical protein
MKYASKGEVLTSLLCGDDGLPWEWSPELIGDSLYINLDADRVIKVSLGDRVGRTPYQGHWYGLNLRVISKTAGQIDFNYVDFRTVLGSNIDRSHPNAHTQDDVYVWEDRGYGIDWYILRPSDPAPLVQAVVDYLLTWR